MPDSLWAWLKSPISGIYKVQCDYCLFWYTLFLGHVLMQQAVLSCGDQALWRIWYLEKKICNFFWVRAPGFQAQAGLQQVQDQFSAGIKFLGLKTTLNGKPDLKNWFLRSDLLCEVVFRPKMWIPTENLYLTMVKSRLSLKTMLDLHLTLIQKKFQFFFSENPIWHNAWSPRDRTACCVNTCRRKGCIKKQ